MYKNKTVLSGDIGVKGSKSDNSSTYVRGSARAGMYSAKRYERKKCALYEARAAEADMSFVPLIHETYGARGEACTSFLKKLAARAASKHGALLPTEGYYARFCQISAVAAQKGNWLVQRQGAQRLRNYVASTRSNIVF